MCAEDMRNKMAVDKYESIAGLCARFGRVRYVNMKLGAEFSVQAERRQIKK